MNIAIRCFAFIIVFLISIYLLPYYIHGDMIHYRKIYAAMQGSNIIEGFIKYRILFYSSKEFGHFFITWIFAQFLSHNIFVGLSNGFLAFYMLKLFQKMKVNTFISFSIILTNYYVYVIYFPAERLKYGILFLVLAFLNLEHRFKFIFFFFLAMMTHASLLVFLVGLSFYMFSKTLKRIFLEGKVSKRLLLGFFSISIPFIILIPQLMYKLRNVQLTGVNIFVMLKSLVLLLILLIYVRDKVGLIALFFPFLLSIWILNNDNRINMFVFMIFICFMLKVRQGLNLPIFLMLAYFTFKTYDFIMKIILYGTGFPKL